MIWQYSLSLIPTFGTLAFFTLIGFIPCYIICGKKDKKVVQKRVIPSAKPKASKGDSVAVTFTSNENKASKKDSKDKSATKTQTEDPDLLSIAPKDTPAHPANKADAPDFKAPVNLDEAGKKDPQYQTLIGLENDAVFGPAKAGPKKIQIKPPNKVVPIANKNPQYETLAGLANDDLFQKKDGDVVKKINIKPPKEVKPKDFKDPQYQTLAGLVNAELFPSKAKEKDIKKGEEKDGKKKNADDQKKSPAKTNGTPAGTPASASKSKTEKDDDKDDDEADKK